MRDINTLGNEFIAHQINAIKRSYKGLHYIYVFYKTSSDSDIQVKVETSDEYDTIYNLYQDWLRKFKRSKMTYYMDTSFGCYSGYNIMSLK